MFSQDVANRASRGASRRKVNFQAAIEDLEGRMLLSIASLGCAVSGGFYPKTPSARLDFLVFGSENGLGSL
jgi:hypothetical protein